MRYISWADAIFVLYSITDKESFEYAERLMKQITQHDHTNCLSSHTVFLVGNKTDLDRYRLVTLTQGMTLATIYKAKFFEINVTEEYSVVKPLFKEAVSEVLVVRKKAQSYGDGRSWLGGEQGAEDVVSRDCQLPTKSAMRVSKTNSIKGSESIKFKPSPAFVQKKSSGLKLLKLFQEKYRDVS
ncbi:unnamed protein product [Soboliphyme baturini]|uniref:small monomeric GTPase n=1 Tax=Soboliphyme baturini TaxID=241478 RepID=A0A183J0P5_9BILA|nr:unnamed protein product [Soboliphyme baturini]